MKLFYSVPGRLQASSHNFLSAIFGILGKFGIGIGNPKFSGRFFFRRKKSENCFVENILGPKKFDFWSKKNSMKKLLKIQNFEISKNFRKIFEISKFWIFIDFFNENFFDQKSIFFGPKFFFDKTFSDFFRRKFCRSIFFRVPISIPNFPKIPKIILRTACDRSKNTNSTHEEKVSLFSPILT